MSKKRFSVIVYWLLIAALLGLFFTNDFGLVDIHKTSFISAVGIDKGDGDEVVVSAQVAVPQPSSSGENVKYTIVQGNGRTIADAMNEINSKTGFYPQLFFCKLILIGEDCQEENLFRMLGCFYRRNYSELTAQVAMCKGKAMEMLSLPATINSENSTAMQTTLSEELKNSANVSSVNLKQIAEFNYSESKACFMPYIEANVQGTSEGGGNGDSVGGESGGQSGGSSGGESGGSGGGQSGGSSGGEGGESGGGQSGGSASSSSGGGSGGSGGPEMEFTARKTVIFSDGKFKGILDERQSFALNILKNKIRLAVLPCDTEETHYTLGLKSGGGGVKLKINGGIPELTINFMSHAQIQGANVILQPDIIAHEGIVQPEVLKAAEDEVKARLESLFNLCVETDCDVLGVKEKLHKFHYKYYEAFKDDILSRLKVNYKIEIKSMN